MESTSTERPIRARQADNNSRFTLTVKSVSGEIAKSRSAKLTVKTHDAFFPTEDLKTGRSWHTATLLLDGTVLTTGGIDASTTFSSAELYDPSTGEFEETIEGMNVARANHTATLLPSGKVLIAGGAGWGGKAISPSNAELYQ